MAFSDPNSITIAGVNGGSAIALPKILEEGMSSTYQNSDESVVVRISHQPTKAGRVISTVRTVYRKIVSDPLTAANDYDSTTVETRIDRPGYGFSVTELQNLVTGHQAMITSGAVTKLYGKEH